MNRPSARVSDGRRCRNENSEIAHPQVERPARWTGSEELSTPTKETRPAEHSCAPAKVGRHPGDALGLITAAGEEFQRRQPCSTSRSGRSCGRAWKWRWLMFSAPMPTRIVNRGPAERSRAAPPAAQLRGRTAAAMVSAAGTPAPAAEDTGHRIPEAPRPAPQNAGQSAGALPAGEGRPRAAIRFSSRRRTCVRTFSPRKRRLSPAARPGPPVAARQRRGLRRRPPGPRRPGIDENPVDDPRQEESLGNDGKPRQPARTACERWPRGRAACS